MTWWYHRLFIFHHSPAVMTTVCTATGECFVAASAISGGTRFAVTRWAVSWRPPGATVHSRYAGDHSCSDPGSLSGAIGIRDYLFYLVLSCFIDVLNAIVYIGKARKQKIAVAAPLTDSEASAANTDDSLSPPAIAVRSTSLTMPSVSTPRTGQSFIINDILLRWLIQA